MTPENLHHLQSLLVSRTGFLLGADRAHLAAHRLGPVARREGYSGVDGLMDAVRAEAPGALAWSAMEAVLNPETWFRRERSSFDTFGKELLPALGKARGGQPVKVWSAGCSTGQEAWSLAIAAREAGVAVEIVATDLSQRALEKARSGAYTGFEIQRGLKAETMLRCFDQTEDAWIAKAELRAMVHFARANLVDAPTDAHQFDIIFCRHLLGDADPARRSEMFDNLERRLVDDGCLFLGPDEQPDGDSIAFRPVAGRKGLFVKSPSALKRAA